MRMRPWNNKAPRCSGRRRGRRSGGRGTVRAHMLTVVVGYWVWGKRWRLITGLHIGSYRGRLRKSSLRARILSAHRVLQGPSRGEISFRVCSRVPLHVEFLEVSLKLIQILVVPPNCAPTTALRFTQVSRILQDFVFVAVHIVVVVKDTTQLNRITILPCCSLHCTLCRPRSSKTGRRSDSTTRD